LASPFPGCLHITDCDGVALPAGRGSSVDGSCLLSMSVSAGAHIRFFCLPLGYRPSSATLPKAGRNMSPQFFCWSTQPPTCLRKYRGESVLLKMCFTATVSPLGHEVTEVSAVLGSPNTSGLQVESCARATCAYRGRDWPPTGWRQGDQSV